MIDQAWWPFIPFSVLIFPILFMMCWLISGAISDEIYWREHRRAKKKANVGRRLYDQEMQQRKLAGFDPIPFDKWVDPGKYDADWRALKDFDRRLGGGSGK